MLSARNIVLGVAALLAVVYLLMNAAAPAAPPPLLQVPTLPAAAAVEEGEGVGPDGEPTDWSDVLDRPYDESVSLLRTKYGDTFPVMVVREGRSESMPVERGIMYLWTDADGMVRKYSFDEKQDPAIMHGGIVRRYDRI